MRVVIEKNHLKLHNSLVKEINLLSGNFSSRNYSKINNVDSLLVKKDISIEKKKNILMNELHKIITAAFSINRKKFQNKDLKSLGKRLDSARKIISKLRDINYYLETIFLQELKLSRVKIKDRSSISKKQDGLAKDELQKLEHMAYKLIEEAVIVDKKLLSEYSKKEEIIAEKEKSELKNLETVLRKETILLEHLEAKIPPSKMAGMYLIQDPIFSHWVARVFALLLYLEHMYSSEKLIFSQLKKNKAVKSGISRKIFQIIKEKAKLLKIMDEKAVSMKRFNTSADFKKELHNLTSAIRL
ncbi:MAG: hypothetical protein AABX25_03700 [Nanoarchaeota archaeon]